MENFVKQAMQKVPYMDRIGALEYFKAESSDDTDWFNCEAAIIDALPSGRGAWEAHDLLTEWCEAQK